MLPILRRTVRCNTQQIIKMGILERKLSRRNFIVGTSLCAAGLVAGACMGTEKAVVSTPDTVKTFPAGIDTPDIKPTQTPIPTVQPTETSVGAERITERAILNLGYWDLAVVGWSEVKGEALRNYNNAIDIKRDKLVAVQLRARNTSDKYVDSNQLALSSRYFNGGVVFGQDGSTAGGFFQQYMQIGGGLFKEPYLKRNDGSVTYYGGAGNNNVMTPPGFGFPLGYEAVVPVDAEDYGFVVLPRQGGLPNPNNAYKKGDYDFSDPLTAVKRGEVAGDFPLIDPSVVILPNTASLDSPDSLKRYNNYDASIQFMGVLERPSNGGNEEDLWFRLNNRYNGLIWTRDFAEALVYLKDGTVLMSPNVEDKTFAPYSRGDFMAKIAGDMPPGTSADYAKSYGLADVRGGVAVLTFKFMGWPTTAAWRMVG